MVQKRLKTPLRNIKMAPKGPSINYVVSRGEGGGGQKLPILLSKKTTKRGSKIANFETT